MKKISILAWVEKNCETICQRIVSNGTIKIYSVTAMIGEINKK